MAQNPNFIDQQAGVDVGNINGTPQRRTVLIVTIVLLVLSMLLLSMRIVKYAQEDEREVALQTNSDSELHIFSAYYTDANGELTIQSSKGDKVVAPGAHSSYTIRLRNNDEIAIDYEIAPHVIIIGTRESFPMLVRMRDAQGNYILGSAEEWVSVQRLKRFTYTGTLKKEEAADYVFEWMWPYESGNDELDTSLGNNENNVGLEVSFAFHSVANLSLEPNGGLDNPDITKTIALAIVAFALLAAATILTIYIIKKRNAELLGEDEPDFKSDTEGGESGRRAADSQTVSVSLEMLAANFSAGAVINLVNLKRRGLIPTTTKRIHIVASPNFHLGKPFIVFASSVSPEAKRIIMSSGGTVFGARR
ncbi:MAG: hypothetical protein IKB95_07405 [Bacteroidales bacterium]|nr:hypothetical protein [Bacteroidales bacterium]